VRQESLNCSRGWKQFDARARGTFHGRFYGPKKFGCKSTQFCVTRCKPLSVGLPTICNAVQHSENVYNSLGARGPVYTRLSLERTEARIGQCLERTHRFGANTQRAATARAFTKARTERSICFGVVAQSQTLIRMTALPCQVEPPHQHSPELLMFCSVALVRASSSHEASTW
jgi:hypothetical protein